MRSRIIPCLLFHKGGLVKTRRFSDARYVGDPLNAVKIFNEKEVDELMFLDIDATVDGTPPRMSLLRTLAVESRMPLCYGGGVASAFHAAQLVAAGIEKVSVSSAALARPQLVRELADEIGTQSVVVTVDVKARRFGGGKAVFTHNGRKAHSVPLRDWCQLVESLGAGEIVVNCIDRDGEMNGYDLALACEVRAAVDCPLTFVGGAGSVADMQALIDSVGTVGAAAGSFFVFQGPYRAVLLRYARPERIGRAGAV